MRWPTPPAALSEEEIRHLIDRPSNLDDPGVLGRAALVGALRELLTLRGTKDRAVVLATKERDRRMEAERELNRAVAELALVRRAWVELSIASPPPGDIYPYPDATG